MAVAGFGAGLAALAANPAKARGLVPASPWSPGLGARMRLVRGAPLSDDDGFGAGIEIALEPGYRTYWRMPGAAGVPPAFDWSASRNLASIAPAWPVPRRFEEAGVTMIGYEGHNVVLPLRVAAADRRRPVELQLTLLYAACKAICVPEKGEAALSLEHDPPGGIYAELIEAAAREVPDRVEAAAIGLDRPDAVLLTIADGGQRLVLRPVLEHEERILDLFVEGPERWLFGAPRQTGDATRHELMLPLLDRPKRIDRSAEIPFTLTILTDLRAVETMVTTRPTP